MIYLFIYLFICYLFVYLYVFFILFYDMAQVYALVISYLRLCFPLCSLCTSGLRLRTATALAKFTCIYSSVWSTLDKSGHFINQVYYLFSLYFFGHEYVCLCITTERK